MSYAQYAPDPQDAEPDPFEVEFKAIYAATFDALSKHLTNAVADRIAWNLADGAIQQLIEELEP